MVDVVDQQMAEFASLRISVGQVVGETFRFVAGNFRQILSRIALPVVGVFVVSYVSLSFYLVELTRFLQTHSERAASLVLGGLVAGLLLVLFLNAIATVAITELVLNGGGNSPRFGIGRPQWRLFAASLRFIPVAVGLLVIYAIRSRILSALGAAHVLSVLWGTVVGGLASYLLFRLCFLMGPVTVGEKGSILRRGWRLSTNHQLRLVAVFIVMTVPLIVTEIAGELVMRQIDVSSGVMMASSLRGLIGAFSKILPEFVILGTLTYAVGLVFWVGGASVLYRELRRLAS